MEANYINPDTEFTKEYILCAAIWYKDGQHYDNQPEGIDDGYIVCGRRHHNCIFTSWILSGKKNMDYDGHIQGFMTSKDRFVDRYEGARIAKEANQCTIPDNEPLFSEDLY